MKFLTVLCVLFFGLGAEAQILGYIDGVKTTAEGSEVSGWACARDLNQTVAIKVYAGGPAGKGQFLTQATTNLHSSDKVHKLCRTKSTHPHRFSILIPKSITNQYENQALFVHGINPNGVNLLIRKSGKYRLPTRSQIQAPINIAKGP